MRRLRDAAVTTSLSTHAEIDVGVVTGKNEFFVLTGEQIVELADAVAGGTSPYPVAVGAGGTGVGGGGGPPTGAPGAPPAGALVGAVKFTSWYPERQKQRIPV